MNFAVTNTLPASNGYAPLAPLAAPAAPVGFVPQGVSSDSFVASTNPVFSAPASTVQFAQPAPSQNFSPYVPTLTALNISKVDLQWATELEAKVQQGYQPTAEESAYYKNIGTQLSMMRENIQPLSPAPALPQIQNFGPAPTAPAAQQPSQPSQAFANPNLPAADKQVTLSEIEWSLILEEKVQKYAYQPTPEEEQKYQNILARFKTNQEIKMEFMDALAAQSPWVGANVASIRYSKIIAGQISNIVGAIKNGSGSVLAGVKGLGMAALKATGLSALVSGGFSAVTNGIAYMQGKKTKTQVLANVATDTVTGAFTGLGATVVGGIAMTALAATSLAGWPVTLIVGAAGMLGGYLADKLLVSTGAKEWVKSKVIGMLEGGGAQAKPAQPAQPAAPAQPQQPAYQAPAYGPMPVYGY
jgi:hypothetical protein